MTDLPQSTRVLRLHAARDLRLESHDLPALQAGQVLVKLLRGGICGSDLHYFFDGGFGAVRLREPMILGHEVGGEIIGISEGVAGLKQGQLVAVSPSRPDWNDDFSREGMPHHSLGMRFYGSAMPMPHIQGAFRQYLVADATQCVPADGLTPEEAAMAEPLAVVLHGLSRAGNVMGKKVLVTGCGPIGCLTILALRAAGAGEIVAVDINDKVLSSSQQCGADRCINSATMPDDMSAYEVDKGYFDLVMECSGAAPALRTALPTIRPQGILVQLGLYGDDVALPMNLIVSREIEVRGTFRFHPEFSTAVHMMQQGFIDVKPLVTNIFSPDDADAAFACAHDKSQSIKVQFNFELL